MKHFVFHRLGTAAMAAACLAAATLLSGCGGGDDTPAATVITAAADSFALDAGQSGQLLANDRLGSAVASAGSGGNVSVEITSGALPAGITVTAGVVTVGAAAVPGATVLSYRICELSSASNCATGSATVTVNAPPIVASADSFNLRGGGSGDVLANDTLGGTAASASRVTASAAGTLPTGVTLTAAGLLSVTNTTAAGVYAIGYRICQTVAPGNCATATVTLTVPALGMLTGRAVDAATGLSINGVRVEAGGVTAVSDSNGAFSLSGVPLGTRVVANFSAATHAEGARIVSIEAATSTDVQVRLVRVGATLELPVASGGLVTMVGSPARVSLPAAGLQRADGSVPSGNVTVRMTPINPAIDASLMPGDYTTLVAGAAIPIESFGALNVQLADNAGLALNLRSGQTASIRIPLGTRSGSPPATIPLYFFNTSTGRWVEEGSATLVGSGTNRYYEGTVTHFSTWNADLPSDVVRVSGCVADANGVRLANALVSSDGVDYSGTTSSRTDAAGNFSIQIRRNSLATLVAFAGNKLTNTVRVGPFAVDSTVSACLTQTQIGGGVSMKLTWGQLPSDLDSWLFTPDGDQIYFGNQGSLGSRPFASLDVDDTSSFGPEVVTVTRLMVGTYKYAVNNYSGQGSGAIGVSGARVELSLPGRTVELFTPPTAGESTSTDWWQLFELDVAANCSITVRRTGLFGTSPPASGNSTTPTYCTPP